MERTSSTRERVETPSIHETPDLKEKLDNFITSLQSAPPIRSFLHIKEEFEKDATAQSLLSELQEKQRSLQQARWSGSVTAQQWEEVRSLQNKLRDYPIIASFFGAQEEAARFLQDVNKVMSLAMGIDLGATVGPGAGAC